MALQGTKALEKWCQIVTEGYQGVRILNMSTSWRNGLGFCAILNFFRPELIDFDSLDPDDAFKNNQLAFEIAEQHLGIPALLDPEDMVQCELLDRLSILTYLSQFYQVFHGATTANSNNNNNGPKQTPSSSETSSPSSSPLKAVPVVIGKRNEPCKICNKSVFIMERLNVSGRLLHRTCFKCKRCNHQLNILNYYETEGGDYCCDMCPDEEKSMAETVEANKKIVEKHLDSKDDAADGGSSSYSEHEEPSDVRVDRNQNHESSPQVDHNDNQATNINSETANDNEKQKEKEDENCEDLVNLDAENDQDEGVDKSEGNSVFEDAKCEQEDNENKMSENVFKNVEHEKKVVEEENNEETNPFVEENDMHSQVSEGFVVKGPEDSESMDEIIEKKETLHEPAAEVDNIQENLGDPKEIVKEVAQKSEPSLVPSNQDDVNYPTDMNPFGDEEEKRIDTNETKVEVVPATESLNPFGSDFDENSEDEDNQESATRAATTTSPQGTPLKGPPKPPRISLNPFGSDFEDDDDEAGTPSSYRTPGSPSNSSSGTIRSRKKRPAPKPPGSTGSPRPASRNSLQPVPLPRHKINSSSPKVTPRRPPPPDSHKLKKDMDNINRRSQLGSQNASETSSIRSSSQSSLATTASSINLAPLNLNKAVLEGQWKKKKGPAPPRPIPQKRQVKKLPRKVVNTELFDIEIKQQELERQGVKLEKTIREVCEKNDRERSEQGLENVDRDSLGPEVEDLIVQLFDLVNEKNDLFRRQTELMYMKKDHRLEEEHADIEHQIRILMGKPEGQRLDGDKEKEEKLIARLMEIVSQRNEIVDCLEMDRLRELEEDESFEIHIGEYAAIKPIQGEDEKKKKKKKAKKEKKKKGKDFDADKDIDTSECNVNSPKPSPTKVKGEKDKGLKIKKKILTSLTSLKKTV